jgi:hypothetical protein
MRELRHLTAWEIPRDDPSLSWVHLAALILLTSLAVVVTVATIVGHGIRVGARSESD